MSDPAARIAAELGATNGQVPPEDLAGWCAELDWAAFLAEDDKAAEWSIEPLVPAGRQVAIYARAGTGKSLLLLDAAAALATGRLVLGNPVVPPVDVVYFDMENPADDVRARMLDLGYTGASALGRFHYFHLQSLPPLDTDLGGQVAAAIVERAGAGLVVVDTTASSVAGEENSADTFRGFYRYTGRRLRSLKASLVRLDHSGKDRQRGQRGSSAKDDDMDVVWEMTEAGEHLALKRTKSRVPWVPANVRVRREEEPVLRHVLAPAEWPDGTVDAAGLLDDLGVGLDASVRSAQRALKDSDQPRRTAVVAAALKYRRRPR